jgi:hypothetical protein
MKKNKKIKIATDSIRTSSRIEERDKEIDFHIEQRFSGWIPPLPKPLFKTKVTIEDYNCVNSRWTARWLLENPDQEGCQCIVGCKVKVWVEMNGHPPHTVIVTKKEYKKLMKP